MAQSTVIPSRLSELLTGLPHRDCPCGCSTCTGPSHIQRKPWQHSGVCWGALVVARQLRQLCPCCPGGSEQGKEPSPHGQQSSAQLATPGPAGPSCSVLHLSCVPDRLDNPLALPQEIQTRTPQHKAEGVPQVLWVPERAPVPAQSTWDSSSTATRATKHLRQSPRTKPCSKTAGAPMPTVHTPNASRTPQCPSDFTVLTCPIAFSKHSRFSKLNHFSFTPQMDGEMGEVIPAYTVSFRQTIVSWQGFFVTMSDE